MQASARLSSSAASRRVIAGVSSAITRSSYRTCRGKAHAAALSGQEPPKGQKRISKNERKVQIEEFVEIYKTSNDGKFPTMTIVRQHIGGSHYTVREILQEVKYNHTKLSLDKSKAAQLHETTESAEQSGPEEDNGSNLFSPQSFNGKQDIEDVLLSQKDSAADTITIKKTGTWRSLELKTPPDSSHCNGNGDTKTSKQVPYTADISMNANDSTASGQTEIQGMKTEASISLGLVTKSDPGSYQGETKASKLHLNNTEIFHNASEPTVSSDRKHDVDEDSQKDSATSNIIMEKTRTPDSSHYTGETEAAKRVSYTTDILQHANDSVSDQTETDSMKAEASISLGLETKSEPGNHQGETNTEKIQNSESNVPSYQTKSDKVIKADAVDRDEKPEVQRQESMKTSLLGSLKSFASGIRNFWKKL